MDIFSLKFTPIYFISVLAFVAANPTHAQPQRNVIVIHDVKHDISMPLSSLPLKTSKMQGFPKNLNNANSG